MNRRNDLIIHTDCRQYKGDRPCGPHKKDGRKCKGCSEYDPIEERILIIKLGAMGDVLRTTSILWGLKEEYPNSQIIWIVNPVSAPLLYNISQIDQIWPLGVDILARLHVERFDIVINMDLSPDSTSLASLVETDQLIGYRQGIRGEVLAAGVEAIPWLEMSLDDNLKKANKKTYQQMMLDLLGLEPSSHNIIVNMNNKELEYRSELQKRFHLRDTTPVIGFNIGAGGRWQHKPWIVESYAALAYELVDRYDAQIIILAGKDDSKRVAKFKSRCSVPVHDPGFESLRRFISVVSVCDLVVTGDTLALHIAAGLGKKIAAIFGPTSAVEIELYGLGSKITSEMDCLGCYLTKCDKDPNCMNSISVEKVLGAIEDLLK